MNNTVDPEKLKKAPLASSCFMGLGQILYLKQYIRGALFALVEVVMLCCIIFGTKKIIPADNKAERYLNLTPDTCDLVDYLDEAGAAEYEEALAVLADAKEDNDKEAIADAKAELADLSKQGYKKFADYKKSILNSRSKELKNFLTKTSVKILADSAYKACVVEADELKDDKEAYKEALSDAKETKKSVAEEIKEALADYDFSDLDDVESAFDDVDSAFDEYGYEDADGNIIAKERFEAKYEKLVSKYDVKLSKIVAKNEAKRFNTEKKDSMADYKDAVKAAKANYKDAKAKLSSESKAQLADVKSVYAKCIASVKAINNDTKKALNGVSEESKINRIKSEANKQAEAVVSDFTTYAVEKFNADLHLAEGDNVADFNAVKKITNAYQTVIYTHELSVAQKKVSIRFNYEKALDKAFKNSFDGMNDFDMHYDGCGVCRKAARNGERTKGHRAWMQGPVVTSLAGLVSLGNKQNTSVAKFMDHSVFMMINGIFCIIFLAFFSVIYALNIAGAKSASKKIIKNGKFPTMKESKNDISQNSFATIGIAPSVVMIAIFSLIPLLFSALVAFTNYSSPDHIPPNNLVDWVGIQNFITMFSTKVGGGEWARTFGNTAIWTIVWAVFATFTCFFAGFFFAYVLQDKRVVLPTFYRTVYILPYAIPTMLSLFVWANLLNGTIGPINHTLQLIHLIKQPVPWLSNPWFAKGALIFVNIWIGFPYSMILTTSSMTAISNSLYEAATIDGATKWDQFKSITYPLVMFQLKPTLIMQFAGNINNFGAVFFLTGGGPNLPQAGLTTTTNCGATDLLISWIYKLTMNTPSRYHLASVLSLLVFVVLVPFALYNFTRTKSFKEGEV